VITDSAADSPAETSVAASRSSSSADNGIGIRVLGLRDIQALVTPAIAFASARRAFEALATSGAVSQPAPMGWDVAEGDVHVKGAWLKGSPIFALKAATGFATNRDRGLPTSSGFVMIFDAATGQPRALLADDGYLTELRTGAAGALAASLLGESQHVCAPGSTVSVANLHGELGAVLLKTCAGRESPSERIICDLTGTGAQDAAIAEAVWTAYQRMP
jgi:ornithine cyclodeaminase/alanine dehydrogenase-like protein (mu-crystallin family)